MTIPGHVEHPEAYARAVSSRIKANGNLTRSRKLQAAIANDSEEFQAWVLGRIPASLDALRVASQAEFDRTYEQYGPAQKEYDAAVKAFHAKVGPLPAFLRESRAEWGGLTDSQLAFARKIFADRLVKSETRAQEQAARRANTPAWTAGRQLVEGEIVAVKHYEGNGFGPYTGLTLRQDDGRAVWFKRPSGLNVERGARVRLNLGIELKDDPTFAIGKRPTKSVVLSTPAEV